MKDVYDTILLHKLQAESITQKEVIQSLWSGYGEIVRIVLSGGKLNSIIVKNISFPTKKNHPRGWNTNISHERKVKSYEVEFCFYANYANRCGGMCRVPELYTAQQTDDLNFMAIEDLDASGFPLRKDTLSKIEITLCLKWLANFHATFMGETAKGLWKVGTYWHLATRPDELNIMADSPLKKAATKIDTQLNNCKHQTLVHGDAKVANFCFSSDMQSVAAVDFQYVGGGSGIKDVIYLMGSCLSDSECERHEADLLAIYFTELRLALAKHHPEADADAIEQEWLSLYAAAWTDFTRFLMGWMPTHQKINEYSLKLMDEVLK